MSKHTMNNPTNGGESDGSGIFDPMTESGFNMPGFSNPSLSKSGFAMPSPFDPRQSSAENAPGVGGEAELRRVTRARLNAYFDAEGMRDRVAAREALHDLTRMPGGTEELAAMRRVLSGFDVRPEHPDLTRVVLAKVAKRGTFLSRPARRRVSAARVLIACSLLVVVGAFVYIDRASTPQPEGAAGAISAVVEAQRSDAAESVRNLARAVDSLRSDLIEPVGALTATDTTGLAPREPKRALSMGDTSDYEESFRASADRTVANASRPSGLAAGGATTASTPAQSGGMPMARLFAPIRSDLSARGDGPNLAAAGAPSKASAARALVSAQDAWTVRPSPSVLIGSIAELSTVGGSGALAGSDVAESASRLTLDLNDFSIGASSASSPAMAPEFIDAALLRGGLLTTSSPTMHEPEVRLRPDGTRTILWWVFPDAPVPSK